MNNPKKVTQAEYTKCAGMPPAYFIEKYCKVEDGPFRLYPFQLGVLDELHSSDHNIIIKSRQLGISSLLAGYSLWLVLFSASEHVLWVSPTQGMGRAFMDKFTFMLGNLPDGLRPNCSVKNKSCLRLANGSTLEITSSLGHDLRDKYSLVCWDEMAFSSPSIWEVEIILRHAGKCVLFSSVNGLASVFYNIWQEAVINKPVFDDIKFNAIKLPWWVHPKRNVIWRIHQQDLLGPRAAAYECDCDLSAGYVVAGYEADGER